MSRDTRLDEAIEQAKADENWELAEWLREARGGEKGARWLTAKPREAEAERDRFKAENAKLRELVHDMWCVMWACSEERCKHRENGCYRVNGNNGIQKGLGECWFTQSMRELGIEARADDYQ